MLPPNEYAEYFESILKKFNDVIRKKVVEDNKSIVDFRSDDILYIEVRIIFNDNSYLDIREILIFYDEHNFIHNYVYHYQKNRDIPVFRYDNEPHWNKIITFPHHKHVFIDTIKEPGQIYPAYNVTIYKVLKEIAEIIMSSK